MSCIALHDVSHLGDHRHPARRSGQVAFEIYKAGCVHGQFAESRYSVVPPVTAGQLESLTLNQSRSSMRRQSRERPFSLVRSAEVFRGIVLVIGGNGSGKSTFVKLLAGLYVPHSASIVKRNPDLGYNRDWYREHFSVCVFDFYLFEKLLVLRKSGFGHRRRVSLHCSLITRWR